MTKITDYKIVCAIQSWLLVIMFLLPVFSNFLQCTETRKCKDQRAEGRVWKRKTRERRSRENGRGEKRTREKKRGGREKEKRRF